MKYKTYDLILSQIIDELYSIEGVNSYEDTKNDFILFSLPLTVTTTTLIYPELRYTLRELVKSS